MKDILLSEDVVPIAEFKARAAHWLEKINRTGHPVMITQNGRPAGIVVSPHDCGRTVEKERFMESVMKGLPDADEGQVFTTAQLKQRLLGPSP